MVTMVPGVFVDELPSAARAVVAVGTSVPVFLGYTEVAELNGTSLRNTPTRVTSMVEFERCFGGAPIQKHVRFSFAETTPTNPGALAISGSHYLLVQTHGFYALHSAMQLYFQNGGGACFVVSVGGYEGGETPGVQLSAAAFRAGLQALNAEPQSAQTAQTAHTAQTAQTATPALIPEAVLLSRQECYALQNQLPYVTDQSALDTAFYLPINNCLTSLGSNSNSPGVTPLQLLPLVPVIVIPAAILGTKNDRDIPISPEGTTTPDGPPSCDSPQVPSSCD